MLKANLLEDLNSCAKFVDSVVKVVCSDSFAKHPGSLTRVPLLATMEKTLILAAKPMCFGQDAVETRKKVEAVMARQALSITKKIEKSKSEFVDLRGPMSLPPSPHFFANGNYL